MYIFSSEADYVYATLTSVSKKKGSQAPGHDLRDSLGVRILLLLFSLSSKLVI